MMKRLVLPLCCLLFSCVSPREGGDAARFDGDWQAVMRDTESVQLVDNLRFDCAPFSESFFLRVRNGMVAGFMQADENYSFIAQLDSRGRFRAQIPTDLSYSYKEAQVSRESSIVLVLQGRLSSSHRSGEFIVGDAALNGQGCTTDVQFVSV